MALLWRHLRSVQVFGANTDVGKTIFTTLLCQTAKNEYKGENVTFVKPVSTGDESDADQRHIQRFTNGVNYKTLVQYDIPVSPHLAAQASSQPTISDKALLSDFRRFASSVSGQGNGWLFIETAGGVHSPAPSSTTQADLYIPLRVPVVLIGDAKLGGISSTIAAFEALHIRGYDVQSVLLFQDEHYQNYKYLADYFGEKHNLPVSSILPPPEKNDNASRDQEMLAEYYQQHSQELLSVKPVLTHLDKEHTSRIDALEGLSTKAYEKIWYPFTQHKMLSPQRITTIDSAHGDCFQTHNKTDKTNLLQSSFDGSSSWWTQGLGHANPQLTLAAAHAAGRYGHVMFAESIHQPAMTVAEQLLEGAQNPRFSRVFFSDNGSTGIEVALKMGLRAAKKRYGWKNSQKLGILGLKGSYHGDTIGAMDAAEPCDYNESVEWYEGKGFWFDYPTVLCSNGQWGVQVPEELKPALGNGAAYKSLDTIFDFAAREKTGEHLPYEKYIKEELQRLKEQGRRFGSLILEPVVLGAGGMALVDPLFQRTLVNVVRSHPEFFDNSNPYTPSKSHEWTGLPVLFDEVFTGLYRLGRFTSASFLGVHPDVSVHAKLLTGGLVPLCTTIASENLFEAFSSDTKADALLHGHSYTAYPIGCQVAVESVAEMQKMEKKGDWDWAKQQGWSSEAAATGGDGQGHVWSSWPLDLVDRLSRNTERVAGAWALGSVLAVHLKDASGTGYSSNAAVSLREALGKTVADEQDGGPFNVHCRVLGNVIYFMTSLKTDRKGVAQLGGLLEKALA